MFKYRFLVFLVILVFFLSTMAAEDWKMPEFMISIWGGPENQASAEALRNAHFNTVMCRLDKLELCRAHGLKVLLFDVPLDKAVELRDDSTVWGYFMWDEPNEDLFYELADKVKAFHLADPLHPAYINLGWDVCPRTFVEVVRPRILSYDEYLWWWKGDYFPMLEEYRAVAQSEVIPLICWVEANTGPDSETGPGKIYPADNQQKLRYSVYTALAYGVKGIQWFVKDLIFKDDKLTSAGKDVAVINAELSRLGPILIGLRSVDVYHWSKKSVPENTRLVPHHHWVQTATPDTVLGTFKDQERKDFIMVVNRRIDREQTVVLRFSRPIKKVEKFNKKAGKWEELPLVEAKKYDGQKEWSNLFHLRRRGGLAVEFVINPGDGELLRLL